MKRLVIAIITSVVLLVPATAQAVPHRVVPDTPTQWVPVRTVFGSGSPVNDIAYYGTDGRWRAFKNVRFEPTLFSVGKPTFILRRLFNAPVGSIVGAKIRTHGGMAKCDVIVDGRTVGTDMAKGRNAMADC